MITIADRLRAEIVRAEKRGITRYRIAQESGVSQSQLSRFAAGENEPKLSTAEKICEAIGVRLAISRRNTCTNGSSEL